MELLDKYKGTPLFEMIINLILVQYGARYACLIETNNFDINDTDIYTKLILGTAAHMRLHIEADDSGYRYLVSKKKIKIPKSDEEMAIVLGFYCVGHGFYNIDIHHIVATIYEISTDTQVIVEVCEYDKISDNLDSLRKHLISKVQQFNLVFKGTKYSFSYKIENEYPQQYYIDNVDDIEFVEQNKDKYAEIMTNEFYEYTIFSNSSMIISKYPLFRFLFQKVVINRDIEDLYEQVEPLSNLYYELIDRFKSIENQLLNHDIDKYSSIWREQLNN